MFKCKSCVQWKMQYESLLVQSRDQAEAFQTERDAWTKERDGLVGRAISMSVASKAPFVMAQGYVEPGPKTRARIMNMPNNGTDLRPPVPPKS